MGTWRETVPDTRSNLVRQAHRHTGTHRHQGIQGIDQNWIIETRYIPYPVDILYWYLCPYRGIHYLRYRTSVLLHIHYHSRSSALSPAGKPPCPGISYISGPYSSQPVADGDWSPLVIRNAWPNEGDQFEKYLRFGMVNSVKLAWGRGVDGARHDQGRLSFQDAPSSYGRPECAVWALYGCCVCLLLHRSLPPHQSVLGISLFYSPSF